MGADLAVRPRWRGPATDMPVADGEFKVSS